MMTTPPPTQLYLQWRNDAEGATWTDRPTFGDDIQYVRISELDAANARIAELEAALRDVINFFRTPHGEWLYGDESTPLARRIQAMAFEMDAKIDELEAARQWVSVDERLPERTETVLVITSEYTAGGLCAEYERGIGWQVFTNDIAGNVTHWMPFPPPLTSVAP